MQSHFVSFISVTTKNTYHLQVRLHQVTKIPTISILADIKLPKHLPSQDLVISNYQKHLTSQDLAISNYQKHLPPQDLVTSNYQKHLPSQHLVV